MRVIADAALRVMLERITPRDLLDMANPSTCKNYILVIGGAFDQYFRSIDVVPVVKGSKDSKTIYFQRADVLTSQTPTKNPEIDKIIQAQRKEICIALGYFFTRFFQIFAALSLTVFDSELVRQGSTVLGQYKGLIGGPAAALGGPVLGGPGIAIRGGGAGGESIAGGRPLTTEHAGGAIGSFKFMRQYIDTTPRNKQTIGYVDYYPLIDRRTPLYFTSTTPYSIGYIAHNMAQGVFGRAPEFLIARLRIRDSRITVDRIYLWKKGEDRASYESDAVEQFDNLHIDLHENGRLKITHPISGEGRDIQKALMTLVRHIERHLGKHRENEDFAFPEITTTAETTGERRADSGWGGPSTGAQQQQRRDTVPAQIRPIYEAVSASYKPVAHCVARSLQLLHLDALGPMGGRAANSYICNYKFLTPNPTGLPRPGEAITTSPGIASLSTLYAVFVNGAPQLSDDSKKEYLELLQKFGALFGSPVGAETKMEGVKDVWEKTMCESIAGSLGRPAKGSAVFEQSILLAPKQMEAAKAGIKKLWQRQLAHVKEVDRLFAAMFVIGKDRKINIHPNILKGGIPGLDAIAGAARKLLANYYVDCETTYRTTVGAITGMPGMGVVQMPAAAVARGTAVAAPAVGAKVGAPAPGALPLPPAQPSAQQQIEEAKRKVVLERLRAEAAAAQRR